MSLEKDFDPVFATRLALREKQIQQSYRPVIGIHKWFARRPGTLFRNLLLAEFNGTEPLESAYWRSHSFQGVIADPFMGGGTPLLEANRLGFGVVGVDVNPMAYWIVRQALLPLDLSRFEKAAESLVSSLEETLLEFYQTRCIKCHHLASVKYFMWVKTAKCPTCNAANDLFPGYLLAEATRHPFYVLVCSDCGTLNEFPNLPTRQKPQHCKKCKALVHVEGRTAKQKIDCHCCKQPFSYTQQKQSPPKHRMWALEYHCPFCKPSHTGRFFKAPDAHDLRMFRKARNLLTQYPDLPIPDESIPLGDETARLHKWGYRQYREMFNERQLLGLGLLIQKITGVQDREVRYALLTVFSDFLRYQNMLCRYDTYALKCQDIFSVHGFPIGLVQCENNLLGIPRVGSGAFRHFLQKYIRARNYCDSPFETKFNVSSKKVIHITGERISANLVKHFPNSNSRQAYLLVTPARTAKLTRNSLDGVFTDPPYYDNVQYAELMDFCFVWLRRGLSGIFSEFKRRTTRSDQELTGNITRGRGLEHFTAGLSSIFCRYAKALKPLAPFVFTYHHNSPDVYTPIIIAILDADLDCTMTLPAAAEMSASLHIAGTDSSVLDSVFVCRKTRDVKKDDDLRALLTADVVAMRSAGVRITQGDVRCLASGHIARIAINRLHNSWMPRLPLRDKMNRVRDYVANLSTELDFEKIIEVILSGHPTRSKECKDRSR